jgi:hypothetical protein
MFGEAELSSDTEQPVHDPVAIQISGISATFLGSAPSASDTSPGMFHNEKPMTLAPTPAPKKSLRVSTMTCPFLDLCAPKPLRSAALRRSDALKNVRG